MAKQKCKFTDEMTAIQYIHVSGKVEMNVKQNA